MVNWIFNRSRNSLFPISNQSILFGLIGAQLFWYLTIGIPLRQSLTASLVFATVCGWGFMTLRVLARDLICENDSSLWFFGPSLGLGLMILFVIRLFTTEGVFISLFLLVPIFGIVTNTAKSSHRWRSHSIQFKGHALRIAGSFFLFVGLIGAFVVRSWNWAAPITVFAGIAAALISSGKRFKYAATAGAWSIVVILAFIAQQYRGTTWWQTAEGVPFDETILETISNGLIKWGPATNPIHRELSGMPAIAYHHLLYLLTGLTNALSDSRPYESLSLIGPINIGITIVASLLLIVRALLRRVQIEDAVPFVVILATFAFLLGLYGEGFGSPSSRFGVGTTLGAIALLLRLQDVDVRSRHLALVAIIVLAVSFSKGPFIYVPMVISLISGFSNWSHSRKILGTVTVTSVATIYWFSINSIQTDSFFVAFWPASKMGGQFEPNLYSLKVLFEMLISPVLLGIVCALFVAIERKSEARQTAVSMSVVLSVAVVSQLFISSTGPRSFELLYVPGVIASSLLLVLHAVSTSQSTNPSALEVGVAVIIASGTTVVAPLLNRPLFTPMLLLAAMSGTFLAVMQVARRVKNGVKPPRTTSRSKLFPIMFSTVVIATFLHDDFAPTSPDTSINSSETRNNWYGSNEFSEVSKFIQQSTSDDDLFAFSLCGQSTENQCETDYRPSALTQRRYLALDQSSIVGIGNPRVWSDIALSQSIGTAEARSVLKELVERDVRYILVNRSRVSDLWTQSAQESGAVPIYSNAEYILLDLGEKN